jgi:acyl-coenzyme A synthetase/AMP-(fatty) acid ligase
VDESENALGPNEKGEIYFKSPVPFSGYFGDPEGTKLAFNSEGFVKSGDIGYIDDNGLLYVLNRVKDMMRVPAKGYGALIVTPIEIEEIINEIDGVMQSAVVGVFDMKIFLDTIYAFVIKDKSKVELTEEFVLNYVSDRVIEAKRITGGVIFVDKFPITPSGKVFYRKLKETATEIHEGTVKSSVDYSL